MIARGRGGGSWCSNEVVRPFGVRGVEKHQEGVGSFF
jgi:hypothetical protein